MNDREELEQDGRVDMGTDRQPLTELHLFAGAGGGILGSVLLGHRIIGAVEYDEYCCKVLEQRQRDGVLEPFPIFQTDIRDFIRHGYAGLYKGRCDIVAAGFPCQPFSVAGKRAGAADPRNMWPATIECIRAVRPRYAFLENVPGLVTSGYFGTILGDLAESGYDARWRILSAAEVGAPHKRDRLWIVAYRNSIQRSAGGMEQNAGANGGHNTSRMGTVARNTTGERDNGNEQNCSGIGPRLRHESSRRSEAVAHTDEHYGNGWSRPVQMGGQRRQKETQADGFIRGTQWSIEPNVGRVAHGVASRVDRLKALGNGQVPAVAAAAWCLLTEGL